MRSKVFIFTEKKVETVFYVLFPRESFSFIKSSVSSDMDGNGLIDAKEAGVFNQKTNIHWFSRWSNVVTVSYQMSSSLESET